MDSYNVFYESKTAKIFYDTQLDTLFLEYLGKVKNDEDFIEINTAVINAFKQLNTQKFVADIRKMGVISVASQQWVIKTLIPALMAHLKGKMMYHAQFMDPTEIFAKISAKNIKTRSAQEIKGFNLVQFSDRAELENYLRSVNSLSTVS